MQNTAGFRRKGVGVTPAPYTVRRNGTDRGPATTTRRNGPACPAVRELARRALGRFFFTGPGRCSGVASRCARNGGRSGIARGSRSVAGRTPTARPGHAQFPTDRTHCGLARGLVLLALGVVKVAGWHARDAAKPGASHVLAVTTTGAYRRREEQRRTERDAREERECLEREGGREPAASTAPSAACLPACPPDAAPRHRAPPSSPPPLTTGARRVTPHRRDDG